MPIRTALPFRPHPAPRTPHPATNLEQTSWFCAWKEHVFSIFGGQRLLLPLAVRSCVFLPKQIWSFTGESQGTLWRDSRLMPCLNSTVTLGIYRFGAQALMCVWVGTSLAYAKVTGLFAGAPPAPACGRRHLCSLAHISVTPSAHQRA